MGARHRRALRGSAAATAATFVALASHILGGGAFPTAMGVIVPLALSSLVCVLLAGHRLSLARLTISVGISQAIFHFLFSVFAHTTSASGGLRALLGAHDHTGSTQTAHHAAAQVGHGSASMPAMDGAVTMAPEMHAHAGPGMLLAHVAAGIVTVAMIYWAEHLPVMLCEFARLIIRAVIPRLILPRTPIDGPRTPVNAAPVIPRTLGVLRSPVLRRGPPQAAF
ncbi:hypothetical protein ACQE2J_18620 [Brevibacterium sp. LE-L]|uniref:hypothetical protein n=1 Tax=Brevibacterium sp. LE-L TaxID=3418557 RepID=UPI003CF93C41